MSGGRERGQERAFSSSIGRFFLEEGCLEGKEKWLSRTEKLLRAEVATNSITPRESSGESSTAVGSNGK